MYNGLNKNQKQQQQQKVTLLNCWLSRDSKLQEAKNAIYKVVQKSKN